MAMRVRASTPGPIFPEERAPSVPKTPRPRRLTHSSMSKSHSMEFGIETPSHSLHLPAARTTSSPHPSPLVFRKRSSSTLLHKGSGTEFFSLMQGSDDLDVGFTIPLSIIAEQHSNDFPLQVKVSDSLYGVCGTASLVDGDTINLHFLKETNCVKAMMAGNRELTVPMNSSLKFSPLYQPNGDVADAIEGREFASLTDLMSTRPLPLVVCVIGQCNFFSQIASGDILVLKKVKKKKSLLGTGYLVCHNIQQNQEVKLTENTRARFSTKPHLVRLRLPQLVKHIELPQQVMVSHQDEFQWSQLRSLFPNNVCTLISSTTETSVIASYSNKEVSSALLEIPTTFDCEVQMKTISLQTKQQLLDETGDLLKEFQPKMINVYISNKLSSKWELMLRRCICEDDWREGVTLKVPDNLEDTENQYEYLPFAVRQQFKPDEEKEELSELQKVVFDLQEKVRTLEEHRPVDDSHDTYIVMRSPSSTATSNKEALGLLTCDQVLQLLDGMKLGEYKPKFESEQINGDLMLELDDSILEHELGVKTRIHRIKLMKIISGTYPVGNYLKQDEDY